MKIGLDFDGVISDCSELKSRMAKSLYGVDIPPGKFKKEIVVGEKFLTLEQYRSLQKQIYNTREIGLTMKEVPGAISGINTLLKQHEVVIITSRETEAADIAREWLMRRDVNIPILSVEYGADKIIARDCSVFIDDDMDKLLPLIGHVPNLFLFGWEYNQTDSHQEIKRIGSWEEFLQAVSK